MARRKTNDIEEKLPMIEPLLADEEPVIATTSNNTTIKVPLPNNEDAPFIHLTANINTGLTTEQVNERTNRGLTNKLNTKSGKSIAQIVLTKIFSPFNLICYAIAALIIFIKRGDAFSDLIFLLIMIANTVIGIFQEIQSKKTLDKLSFENAPKYKVIRDGNEIEINSDDIVTDDIILLESGQKIPADGKIRNGKIEVNESLITGEANSISKGLSASLYGGSFVVSGSARIQITNVGEESYIQKLAKQARTYQKPRSEIMLSVNLYIKIAVLVIIPTIFVLFMQMLDWNFSNLSLLFSNGSATLEASDLVKLTTAILGVLPTGLVLLTSISLFASVNKLGKKSVMVQELYCIEMLARVDTLCLDKTGTITDGTMSIIDIKALTDEEINLKQLLSNFIYVTKDRNQTAMALEAKFGRAKRCKSFASMPFSSSRKFSAVSFSENDTYILGAPEFISKELYKKYFKEINTESRKGNRVIMLARANKAIKDETIHGKIDALALIVIQDNIREAAPRTLNYFKNNNVKVLVISGDNPMTVAAIAKKAGVRGANKFINMVDIKDDQIPDIVDRYTIFGRVTPAQKQLLVKALKEKGHTVAMTGDGVNDILALKEADCSIAMAAGSEAARNVSQLILTNNDFGAMPFVVSEGRKVINNITKVATLFISKNLFCFLICLFVILMNFGLFIKAGTRTFPLLPSQLSLIDSLTIGIPATILALSPNNKQISGRFMYNVLKNALPGALVILFNVICIYSLAAIPHGIDPINIPTLITISTSITCLIILIRIFLPMNIWKIAVIFGISITLILIILFSLSNPNWTILWFLNFSFTKIILPSEWLLLIVLAEASYPLIWLFSLSFTKIIKKFINDEINSWKNNIDNDAETEDDIYEDADLPLDAKPLAK